MCSTRPVASIKGRADAEQFERIRHTPGLSTGQHRPDHVGEALLDPETPESA